MSDKPSSTETPIADLNLVVLAGHLSSAPIEHPLPSGSTIWSFEVTTREAARGACSVPVSWLDPTRPPALVAGDAVVVLGRVRRRFFRTPNGTQSRTEVAADAVIAQRGVQVRRLAERAAAALTDAIGAGRVR